MFSNAVGRGEQISASKTVNQEEVGDLLEGHERFEFVFHGKDRQRWYSSLRPVQGEGLRVMIGWPSRWGLRKKLEDQQQGDRSKRSRDVLTEEDPEIEFDAVLGWRQTHQCLRIFQGWIRIRRGVREAGATIGHVCFRPTFCRCAKGWGLGYAWGLLSLLIKTG